MTHPDDQISEQYRDQMREVAVTLDRYFNEDDRGSDRKIGFVLLVFPFGVDHSDDHRCNYISNGADRKEIVALMKEMIARFEGQPKMSGRA